MTEIDLPVRQGTADDFDAIAALLHRAFLSPPDPEAVEIDRGVFEPARSLIVTAGGDGRGDVVGHAAALTRELTVPGAVLPAAHVTMVGVAATHRRRGLLTRMMHRQLREIRDAGRESFAVLWASQGRIYPRYGYGLAAHRYLFEIVAQQAQVRRDWQQQRSPAVGTLRDGEPGALRADLATVYERVRPRRPGWSSRDDAWWRVVLADTEKSRKDHTELRAIVLDGPDGPRGYATYATKGGWDEHGPAGEVAVREVMADDADAYTALWDYLLNIDLTRTVRYSFAAVDEPLLHLVTEPARLGARLSDALWVRLVDVAAALADRRYAGPVDVVIDVTDPLLPENTGRWRLVGDRDGASCAPTTAAPDLACDVRDLGAAYLGGTALTALAAAGRLRELRPGAVHAASAGFGWPQAPSAVEVF